jgi:hypothetical protein
MKNITLSAPEPLIESARAIAASRNTSLNVEFRSWLESYTQRAQVARDALAVIEEEMNARR